MSVYVWCFCYVHVHIYIFSISLYIRASIHPPSRSIRPYSWFRSSALISIVGDVPQFGAIPPSSSLLSSVMGLAIQRLPRGDGSCHLPMGLHFWFPQIPQIQRKYEVSQAWKLRHFGYPPPNDHYCRLVRSLIDLTYPHISADMISEVCVSMLSN